LRGVGDYPTNPCAPSGEIEQVLIDCIDQIDQSLQNRLPLRRPDETEDIFKPGTDDTKPLPPNQWPRHSGRDEMVRKIPPQHPVAGARALTLETSTANLKQSATRALAAFPANAIKWA